MPHLSGVFEEFPDLEKVSIEEIEALLSAKLEIHSLVNFLGNRILYPQAISTSKKELEIDLAILRFGAKARPGLFYEPQSNRILIPDRFAKRFPDLPLLLKAIVEGINPKGVHFVFIKDQAQLRLIGSVVSPISPQKLSTDGKIVQFTGLAITKPLPLGAVSFISTPSKAARIRLGTEEFDSAGGEAGIIIDLRMGGFV